MPGILFQISNTNYFRLTNDFESEIQAYEGMGLQYYYLGDMKKSNYYVDRMMRGKAERKDSKIREIYLSQLEYRKKDRVKNSVSFVHVHELDMRLSDVKNGQRSRVNSLNSPKSPKRLRSPVNRKNQSNLIASGFKEVSDFYRNAFSREHRPIQIRPGTPISDALSNDFPSPRVGGVEDNNSKNYDVLPNFTVDKRGIRIDSDQYLNISFKSIMRQKRLKKVIPMKHSHKGGGEGSIEIICETKGPTFTDNRILLPEEEKQRLHDI